MKRTPLYDTHVALGAKMVPFAGYEMPVQYPTGITTEHKAVREAAGLFDVSHMGEFVVKGPQAIEFVNYVTTNDVSALQIGQAHYTAILNERGTIEDDCLVYRFEDHLLLVVNASNKDKDLELLSRHVGKFDCVLEDISDSIALLALQGPKSDEILARHTSVDLSGIRQFHFAVGTVAGVEDVIISRTGYTGENGFELYFNSADSAATKLWDALTSQGDVTPAGLGCRDSLRLEMGMALYGNDIDDTVTPYEAGFGWVVKMKKGDFIGKAALEAQKEAGVPKKLIGFTISERAFPRPGYPVYYNGEPSGTVRSGTLSPSLNIPIGTAYLPFDAAKEGTEFEIEIRGKRIPAVVQKFPFLKKS